MNFFFGNPASKQIKVTNLLSDVLGNEGVLRLDLREGSHFLAGGCGSANRGWINKSEEEILCQPTHLIKGLDSINGFMFNLIKTKDGPKASK